YSPAADGADRDGAARLAVDTDGVREAFRARFPIYVKQVSRARFPLEVDQVERPLGVHDGLRLNAAVRNTQERDLTWLFRGGLVARGLGRRLATVRGRGRSRGRRIFRLLVRAVAAREADGSEQS